MNLFFSSVFWLSVYLALVLAPLLVLFIGPVPPGTGFWWDFSIGLGLGAVALMVMMSLLTARFRRLTAPFGIDVIYYFHRQIALVLLFLVIVHVATLFSIEPLLVYSYRLPGSYPIYTGTIALTCIVALVVSSIGRRQFGFPYEGWRRFHAVFAVLTVGFTLAHMATINYYTGIPSQIVLWSVFATTWLGLLLYVRLVKPVRLLNRPYQLVDISREGGDTWTLSLAALGHSGFRFMPGQFAWISANHSPLALAEHPFSFSSSAEHPEKIQFTIKELGDFTSTIKDLVPGQRVYVDGPFGTFTVDRYSAAGYFLLLVESVLHP